MQEVADTAGSGRVASIADRETLAVRLAHWAQHKPDQPALIDSAGQLSWAELDREVTAIASAILARMDTATGRVMVLSDDRLSTIAAILGAVRSGNTFVVLEAADPDERMRFIIGNAEPSIILTQTTMLDRVAALAPAGCEIVDIADARASAPRPMPAVDADSIAYISFTSGSTGQAKGVCQTHASQRYFIDIFVRNTGVGGNDRFASLYSLAFGAGLSGMARAIAHGATLCSYDVRRQGVAGLADWLDRERVTLLQTFALVFREMAAQIGPKRVFPHLRIVQLSGDSTFAEDFERVRAHTRPDCRFLHQFAATEVSLVAQNLMDHDVVLVPGSVIPVGRVIEGVRLELRRDDGTPADPGEAGEVHVFSRHVSPGYWKRPDLDAKVFMPDPLDPQGRGYRMGDIARFDADGMLHFIGRIGTRVKIRGHTVDLAEVDAALVEWPDAAKAAIAAEADPDDATQKRLVAYIEAREGARRDTRALMAFLAEKLPRHMLPAEVRFIAAMPRTASGKLDRKRLAAETVLPPDGSAYSAPRDATEAAVAHMFTALLKLDRAGRDDDFFLVGGDSMVAADLQARIKEAFGVRLPGFHEDATVAGIAAAIRGMLADGKPRGREMPMLVPMWRNGNATPLFMVHGRHGQAFVSPHFMKVIGDDQPVWAFQARGLDGASAPHPTVELMVDDYAAEIRKVRPRGPYLLGGLCVGCYVAAAIGSKLRAEGEVVLPLLLLDPPNRVKPRTAAHAEPDHVMNKMLKRRGEGRSGGPMEDPEYLEISVQTAAAFNEAVSRYVPIPYEGPVYVLSSRHRMQLGDPLELRRYFTGRVKRYEVGNSHNDALDPRNPVFAATLKRCMDLIHAAAPVGT